MKNLYLMSNWGGIQWTPWYSFQDVLENRQVLPTLAGMYRIKPVGYNHLMYIGQTGRNLRERVTTLIQKTLADDMPYNDPHTAAPSLWAWRDAEGLEFECSVAPIGLTRENREGFECFLLWQYRLERGESTLCNHGRFHGDYIKSKSRRSQFRGRRLKDTEHRNDAGGESMAPLQFLGNPASPDFMGLLWSDFIREDSPAGHFPSESGVYRVKSLESGELLYIGESTHLRNRTQSHIRKDWGQRIGVSYCVLEDAKPYQLKEIENDLIGGYFSIQQTLPRFQFKNFR